MKKIVILFFILAFAVLPVYAKEFWYNPDTHCERIQKFQSFSFLAL